jgi:hypothetical protein
MAMTRMISVMGGIDLKTKAAMAAWLCDDQHHEEADSDKR